MATLARKVYKRRETITALPLYYSGHLLKKYTGEKDFKSFFGELRGSTIFLYTDDTQDTYSEKLNLQMLKSMTMDSKTNTKSPMIYTLTFHNEEVQLKMDNRDTGEEWRGFIITVATREIPSKLQLLPGQIMKLNEILAQEKKRQIPRPDVPPRRCINPSSTPSPSHSPSPSPSPTNIYDDGFSGLPLCFFDVSRQEAEQMLNQNPEYGSIIIRPSAASNNYALTLRQEVTSGPPVMKNYRLRSENGEFVIELDTPVTVPSLRAVVNYFLEQIEYSLRPYLQPRHYDTRIELAPATPKFSSTAPKPVPRARVAPIIHTQRLSEDLPPASPPPSPPTEATAAWNNEYMVPDDEERLKKEDRKELHEELRAILKVRRTHVDSSSD